MKKAAQTSYMIDLNRKSRNKETFSNQSINSDTKQFHINVIYHKSHAIYSFEPII